MSIEVDVGKASVGTTVLLGTFLSKVGRTLGGEEKARDEYQKKLRTIRDRKTGESYGAIFPWQHEIARALLLDFGIKNGLPIRYVVDGPDLAFGNDEVNKRFLDAAKNGVELGVVVWSYSPCDFAEELNQFDNVDLRIYGPNSKLSECLINFLGVGDGAFWQTTCRNDYPPYEGEWVLPGRVCFHDQEGLNTALDKYFRQSKEIAVPLDILIRNRNS